MKLSVLKRNQLIQKIDLGKDVLAFDYSETIFLIGRSKDCHVVLDDMQISREHLRIIHKNGKWSVEKTAEGNFCLHNGENFKHAELKNLDSLNIGIFAINIELAGEVMEPQTPPSVEKTLIMVKEALPLKDQNVEVGTYNVNTEETSQDSSFGEVTEEIKIPSDFTPENQDNSGGDEFNYSENIDSEAEAALGLTSSNLSAEQESPSYSLENIDRGENESTKVIQSFSKVQLELFGETAPYDKYLIEAEKTFIGRDPAKCQIVLNDSEVSSVHAVITKNNIVVMLEDLNSSNGTILNGDRINKSPLIHNSEFVIGGVTFIVKFDSDFLQEESSTLMAVDENQTIEVEEIVEIQAEDGEKVDALGEILSNEPEEKSIIKRIWKDEQKRKKAIYALVGLVVAWVMLDDGGDKAPTPIKKPKKAVVKSEPIINKNTGKKLSEEERSALSARYEIGKNHYQNGRYREALDELQKIALIDPNFNSSLQSLLALSKEGLSKLEEQEKKRVAEQLAAEKKIKIRDLVSKATEYVKDRRVELVQDIFNEIAKIDPENIEVARLKLEIDDWQKEKARKELEIATKKKNREDKVEKLKPAKALFIQKEWFKTIGKLEDFLKIKDMDDDLTKEASEMLKTSRDEVSSTVAPLLGKAKSLMEGQDLKGTYEVYLQVLRIEPSNTEALNAVADIKEQLTIKARKIYREAIISESMSLFQDAKEKFQEVQQVSPVDSDYYKKATDKLKDYLE